MRLRERPRRGRGWSAARFVGLGAAVFAAVSLPFGLSWWGGSGSTVDRAVRIEAVDRETAEALVAARPPPPQPFLDTRRIVSYYGNPLAAQMGVLGEHEPADVVRRLKEQAAVYQRLSPDRTVVPALHMIYAVAQEQPGTDGTYLLRMEDELVWEWVRLAQENDMLLFLDIQFGRSSIEREFPHVAPFLKEPNVHLALDPEFAWEPDEYPLVDIGSIDAATVNRAQELLEQLIVENRLPNKVLVVHQFRPDMLTGKASIRPSERVETVIDADGFGSPSLKLDQWRRVIQEDNVQRAGIKLFYKQDAANGGLMSEEDVIKLTPTPVLIIYQ